MQGNLWCVPSGSGGSRTKRKGELIGTLWGRLIVAVEAIGAVVASDGRGFADRVLPFSVMPGLAATGWSVTEASWKVTLTGDEPPATPG